MLNKFGTLALVVFVTIFNSINDLSTCWISSTLCAAKFLVPIAWRCKIKAFIQHFGALQRTCTAVTILCEQTYFIQTLMLAWFYFKWIAKTRLGSSLCILPFFEHFCLISTACLIIGPRLRQIHSFSQNRKVSKYVTHFLILIIQKHLRPTLAATITKISNSEFRKH